MTVSFFLFTAQFSIYHKHGNKRPDQVLDNKVPDNSDQQIWKQKNPD